MKIGIFTYGTRGDLQPSIALALRLKEKGHEVTLSATEDFKDWVEGFGIPFVPLFGHAESMMNGPEGQSILKSGNPLQLMKYYFKVLHDIREPLRKSYYEAIEKVDYIIANSMTIPIVSAIAEKQEKPLALTYFMPPMVPTRAFPIADFDFLNFPWYNRMTYQIAQAFFWTLVKKDSNEYRRILGLAPLRENLLRLLDKQKILDLYCISPELISRPDDWESHHQITGFLTLPKENREKHAMDQVSPELMNWLNHDDKPIYIGFGSNGIGDQQKWLGILSELLEKTQERILFCTGWSLFDSLPSHKNLFVTKYVNHEAVLPRCKIGIFHGGAGTLATMIRNNLPVIILSLYTDQPAWGKIVERKKLGIHIPFKKIQTDLLIKAIHCVQSDEYKNKVLAMGANLRLETGVENAVNALEKYVEASGPGISGKREGFRSRPFSKKYLGMLLLLLTVFFSNYTMGQNQAEKIRQIRAFCQNINANHSLTQKTVDEETLFQGNTPDGGGSLVGYFEKGELCKMDFTLGVSYGEITKSYYLENGHLVFLYLKEKLFPVKAGTDSLDLLHLQPSFEGRYYFDKDTLIDKITRGKKRLEEGSLPDFPREARELARMLNARSK